jgi:hypothetical protein
MRRELRRHVAVIGVIGLARTPRPITCARPVQRSIDWIVSVTERTASTAGDARPAPVRTRIKRSSSVACGLVPTRQDPTDDAAVLGMSASAGRAGLRHLRPGDLSDLQARVIAAAA